MFHECRKSKPLEINGLYRMQNSAGGKFSEVTIRGGSTFTGLAPVFSKLLNAASDCG